MPYMRMAMAIANVSGPLQVKKRGDGARTPWEMKTISYLLLAGFIFLLSGFVTFVLPSSAGDSGGILRKTQSPLGEKKLCMFYPNPETTFLQYQLLKVSKCHTSLPVRRAIALARTSIRPGPTRHSSPASEEQVKHGFLCSGATPRSWRSCSIAKGNSSKQAQHTNQKSAKGLNPVTCPLPWKLSVISRHPDQQRVVNCGVL